MTDPLCLECFAQHHVYAHYLRLIGNASVRPTCSALGARGDAR
jgi:hypothetical protein